MPTSHGRTRSGPRESGTPNRCRLTYAIDSYRLVKRCTRIARREGSFLADADLNGAIVRGVLRREQSVDFVTAHIAGLRGLNDQEVLALAAERQRVLVSHDVGTMSAHFRAFRAAGKGSAGVFLISQSVDVGIAIDELVLIWTASEASDGENRLAWLSL
jgi:hypothetical protein